SGGAILGDRIRMQRHAIDKGVYIRSFGTRGKRGGLSRSTREVLLLLDAAGFDVLIIETAGVGQTELDILQVAQTVVVILVPESGDYVQVMKAGLMEIAGIFVVNKCDRPEADQLVRELNLMISMGPHHNGWITPVTKTEATREQGLDDLFKTIFEHQKFLSESGKRFEIQKEFLKSQLAEILIEKLQLSIDNSLNSMAGKKIIDLLIQRKNDPYSAAKKLYLMIKKG
ncbi:MAG: methylmalonyl Co-A mutase-associated GTPase MeaB, partial [Candidatus Poribacteria bacterium]